MTLQIKRLLSLFLLLACSSLAAAQLKTGNSSVQNSPGTALYSQAEIDALIAAVISGTGMPKLTDALFSRRPLFELSAGRQIPTFVGTAPYSVDAPPQVRVPISSTQEVQVSTTNRGQLYDSGGTPTRGNLGVFNVRDFQARDNDSGDNTKQIQDAVDAASAEGGGVVRLAFGTNGVYRISSPIIYKKGVIIEGETSALGAKVKLKLTSSNSSAISVGGNLISVHIRNIELVTTGTKNSRGILFAGSGGNATQMVTLENITVNGFTRGVSVEAGDSTKGWQMSYVTARNLVLHDCLYGVYLDSINSDWNFDNLLTYTPRDGYGVYVANAGTLQFNHPNFIVTTTGGPCSNGVPNPGFGTAAIQIEGHHGAITVINGQQEGFRKTLVQNREDWTYPIVFMNTVMAAPIELNADTVFVSIGNYYYDDTVQAKGDTRIYSMGDSVDSRTHCLGPGKGAGGFTLSGGAFIIKRESIYGTDYQMPVSINAAAPRPTTSDPNNPTVPLFNIGSPNTSHIFMRLGQTDPGTKAFTANYFDISRDHDGLLNFFGSQPMPYTGIKTNGTIKALHYEGLGSVPGIAAGPAAGSGASATITGTDSAFEVTLRAGSGARSGGTLFKVTFSTPYTAAPYEVFSASSPDSASLTTSGTGVFSTSTNTTVVLASTGAISDGRVYKFKFQVKQ
jgi:hypothetical protein